MASWPSVPIEPDRPRPHVPVAAALMLAGAGVAVLGCVLTWGTFPDSVEAVGVPRSFNGFTEFGGESRDGPIFAVFAVIVAAFGITTLTAKRLLPIMIIGIVVAAFGALAGIVDFADVNNVDGEIPAAFEPTAGPGLPVVVIGFLVALGGFIAGIAKRRT